MENYKSEYVNEYGEAWIFELNYSTNTGLVRGSDIDWKNYPVIEGLALDLILNNGEKSWLKSSWDDATKHLKNIGIYLGLDTEFKRDKYGCWLTNDYCPICLKQKREFEYHHCIWSMDGGTDDYFNMLRICNTCHAILTRGSVEDRVSKDQAAYFHQIMYFGVEFFPRNNPRRGRHKDRNYLELYPKWKKIIEDFDGLEKEEQKKVQAGLMETARFRYQYFRDMGLGKWSWDEYEQEQKKYKEYEKRYEQMKQNGGVI